MALNLSTLTSPANSSVLEEVNTTADFLESVPVFRNLSRSSNRGSDAKQDVALNQPKALPLIDGDGYLYCPTAASNSANVENPIIPATADFDLSVEFVVAKFASGAGYSHIVSQYQGSVSGRIHFGFYDHQKRLYFFCGGDGTNPNVDIKTAVDAIVEGQRYTARVTRVGNTFTLYLDGVLQQTATSGVATLQTVGTQIGWGNLRGLNGAIFSVTEGSNTNIDFTATNVRHGDTKFKCATGQVVTINQSGNDPAMIIKKPVLRFANKSDNSTNIALSGLLNQVITDGYMFAAFSVLGNGGESFGRILGLNATGGIDSGAGGVGFRRNGTTNGLMIRYNENNITTHSNLFDDERGDYLLDVKVQSGSQQSKANNADLVTGSVAGQLNATEFNIASFTNGIANNPAIDLEYLALFSADSVPDEATASKIRDYINKRNNVFSLVDNSYYFFDPQKADFTGNFTDANTLDGYITGSDLGDTDVRTDLTLVQATLNDQPSTDGYTITFNDAAEHLEFENSASQNLSGWQVVGTSLGTFAYRVNANAVTELNLLGNLGNASYRQAGQSYGMILLPDSATGADIEAARKLLIDRGAADGATSNDFFAYWSNRYDIVEFKHVNTSSVTSMTDAWFNCNALSKFPLIDTSNVTSLRYTFYNTNLESFPAIQAPLCTNFTSAWQNCSALSSFPADAKLGTAATGTITFDSAWNSSGLTSFSTPLPTATSASIAWGYCSALTQFNLDSLPVVLNVSQAWRNTGLTSFNTNLPSATSVSYAWYRATSLNLFGAVDIKNCSDFTAAWQSCSALTSFPSDALLGTEANNVNFTSAWQSSGLTSFSTPLPTATTLVNAFRQCNSLTSFDLDEIPLATNCQTAWPLNPALTSFSTKLPKCGFFNAAWYNCSALTDFTADVFNNWNPSSITDGVFNNAWDDCTSLTAQSVENILTSIDASNQHGTDDGTSTGNPLGDSGIDIDYNGDTLSAATNAAIDSLSGKGWEVYINGVLVIPNILDLAPAAAYSLRSFDADADPNVVNVRRSSDSALRDFTASEVSDGTLVAFVGAGNDGHVTTWYDQSIGGTNHATQTSGSAQPKLVDAGTLVTEGGLAALDFDGVNNYLELANGSISLPCSTFVTQKLDSVINSAYTFGIQQSGNNGGYVLRTNGYQVIDAASPFPSITLSGASDTDEHLIYVSAINGGKISGAVDGGTLEQSTDDITGWTSAAYATTIGRRPDQASLHLNGKLKELIHFNTDQSANRTGIEAEIMDTYSIS